MVTLPTLLLCPKAKNCLENTKMAAASKASTIVLISGSNRGLGRALATRFLSQPNTTVIAGVRNPEHPTSQSLSELPHGSGSKLISVKIDSLSDTDAQDAVELIRAKHGINRLDIVVANAGFGLAFGDLSTVKPQEVQDCININTLGPLRLFQATRPLLEDGHRPRFVLIGSPIASIAAMEKAPYAMFAYGASKAAAHYLTRKVHCESPKVAAFVIDPGFMQTDTGNTGARLFGMKEAPVRLDDSADFAFG
ncbi:hypothetical protein GGR54DRAFT_613997 [Hypoxylon sp. NC1633]|nr:hypothetical protein GGR54DRAFT_613997 [Hypoxylon sp. NC1633]